MTQTLAAGLAVTGAILACSAGYLARGMFLPTRGRRIACYPQPKKALLVLDIQESGHGPEIPFPAQTPLGRMISNVNRLTEAFNGSGHAVAYVRQVFRSSLISRLHGGRILAGRLEPRICRWVRVVNRNDFVKDRTDAFSNQDLERFLIEQQVDELYLTGLDAAFCVYFTARGGLNRGYRVTVVSDAVMTGRDMNRVLERYRRHGIAVVSSRELLETLGSKADDDNIRGDQT
jgi:nicotinamidase-related amidase